MFAGAKADLAVTKNNSDAYAAKMTLGNMTLHSVLSRRYVCNSRIIRLEAHSPAGPYTFVQEVVGRSNWNPMIQQDPTDGSWPHPLQPLLPSVTCAMTVLPPLGSRKYCACFAEMCAPPPADAKVLYYNGVTGPPPPDGPECTADPVQ
eukprot:gene8108-7472_t